MLPLGISCLGPLVKSLAVESVVGSLAAPVVFVAPVFVLPLVVEPEPEEEVFDILIEF